MPLARIPPKCKGLKGDALLDCIDAEEAKSASTAHAAHVLAGFASASPGEHIVNPNTGKITIAGAIGGGSAGGGKFGSAVEGALNVTSGTNPVRCHIIGYHDAKFGRMWDAFVARNSAGRRKYKDPIDVQIQALQKSIDKLNEQNSIGAKIEKFFTSPLTLITAAIAAYTTMGASLGATVASIVKDDDSIEAAIGKLNKLKDELTAQSLKWFYVFYPAKTDDYFPVGSRIRCATDVGFSENREGTQPIHRNFKLWLEEEF